MSYDNVCESSSWSFVPSAVDATGTVDAVFHNNMYHDYFKN